MRWPKIPYLGFLALPGMAFVVGIGLNKICMAFNGGLMPVLEPACHFADDGHHTCMSAATHLRFLADWLRFPSGTWSLGDLLINAGEYTAPFGLVIWAVLMIKEVNALRRYR